MILARQVGAISVIVVRGLTLTPKIGARTDCYNWVWLTFRESPGSMDGPAMAAPTPHHSAAAENLALAMVASSQVPLG